MFTYSRSFISQAGLRYRFGPAHCVKEHLSEKTGSMSRLACPTWIIAVECPIQVYLIQLSKLCLNEGFCLGQGNSYYSLMKSSFVDGSLTVSPPCVTLYLRNVKAAESPPVTIEFLILSNRKSNTPLTLSAFFRYLYSFFIYYYSEYTQQYSPSSCWRFKLYQKSNINIWQTLFSSLFHYIQSNIHNDLLQQIAVTMKDSSGLPTTFKPLIKTHTGPIYTIKFNKEGEYCMTGSQDRSVCLYNPAKNIMIKHYKNIHNYDVYSLDITKDNTKFVTGGGDKNIIVTDVVEGKYIRKFTGHTARINSVCFNQDNNVIVSASYDTSVRCWDNRNDAYHPIEIIKGFKDSVSQVSVFGAHITCASMDGSVKVFDIRKGEVTTDEMSEAIQRFDIAKSRKAYVVSATNNKLYLIQKSTGIKIQEYSGHHVDQFTVDVLFNTKDTHLMTGSADGKLFIYDLMKKSPVKEIEAHDKVLSCMDLHESGGMVTASHDGSVCYWKI